MSKVLIFSGTTEGRELAQVLSRNEISCDVCVATEYGSLVMPELQHVTVHEGRLNCEEMKALYKALGVEVVVDATHPYASIVTETIQESMEGTEISYLRLLRPRTASSHLDGDGNAYYASAEECANALLETEGTILLTTGSKDLGIYCKEQSLKKRLVVRVLPGMESLDLCYENGLDGKQIIAMQGPFSKEMNMALMREYNIRHMVTKESGHTGGVESKISAAEECHVKSHIICRPESFMEKALTMEEVCNHLESLLGASLKRGEFHITLAGIGCGSIEMMTQEVEKKIQNANYLFGASRMIENCNCRGQKYPYYLAKDIIPMLKEIRRSHSGDIRVVILFSGDSGFYSGASKMRDALLEEMDVKARDKSVNIEVLPGISSIQTLSARIGIPWQDAKILSFHGVEQARWIPEFIDALRYEKKVFFLTSGIKDIRRMAACIQEIHVEVKQLCCYLGYGLSYGEEEVYCITADSPEEMAGKLASLDREGLYVGAIVQEHPVRRPLMPELRDEEFIRDRVPMTKEEVRKLAISYMELSRDSIVYDIGAGSGSVALQIGLLSPELQIYALECNDLALNLIQRNKDYLNLENVQVVKAMAPDGISDLPPADAAFIGGSKGNLQEILEALYAKNSRMRVVMTAVSMESIVKMQSLLENLSIEDVSVSQVAVNRVNKLGEYHMLQANNPVFIFSFRFC